MTRLKGTLPLVALLLISGCGLSLASAETTSSGRWLLDGSALVHSTSAELTANLVLGDAQLDLKMECGGIFDGWVGAAGAYEVSQFRLGKVAEGRSNLRPCRGLDSCANATATAKGLPWSAHVETLEDGSSGIVVSLASYLLRCFALGVPVEDECTSIYGLFLVESGSEGVIPRDEITPLGFCDLGGENSVLVEFLIGSLLRTSAGLLLVAQ